jgi:hypothetical protein
VASRNLIAVFLYTPGVDRETLLKKVKTAGHLLC